MTFDDFKKHFETFSKIDSAEKLAICERQYQRHLLHIEDEKYFEPTDKYTASAYERNLFRIFSLDAAGENSFSFLVIPSFEQEQLLVVKWVEDQYFATLTTLTESYWAAFYANNKIVNAEKRIIQSELPRETGSVLFALLDKTIAEARTPKAKSIVLDGVAYHLSKHSANKLVTVMKHSPDPNSKSGKIIAILEELIKNVEHPDDKALIQLSTEINKLLN